MKWGVVLNSEKIRVSKIDENSIDVSFDYIIVIKPETDKQNTDVPIKLILKDMNNKLMAIKLNEWSVSSIVTCSISSSDKIFYNITFIDPTRDTHTFNWGGDKLKFAMEHGYPKLIKFIFEKITELSKFKDVNHYKLKIHYDLLKNNLTTLKKEMLELEEENNDLRNENTNLKNKLHSINQLTQ